MDKLPKPVIQTVFEMRRYLPAFSKTVCFFFLFWRKSLYILYSYPVPCFLAVCAKWKHYIIPIFACLMITRLYT